MTPRGNRVNDARDRSHDKERRSRWGARLSNERGQAIIMAGMGLATLAFVGLVAVAVDTAMLANAATEVQTVADAAAAAGASGLLRALRNGASNDSATSAATTDANTIATQNRIEGHPPVLDGGSSNSVTIEAGNYNPAGNPPFSSGALPLNAVRASVTASVSTIAWSSTATVNKVAIAGLRPVTQSSPNLPFMVGNCYYTAPTDCANPTSTSIDFPNVQRSTGWTNWNMDSSNIQLLDALTAAEYNDPAKGPYSVATTLASTWWAKPMGGSDLYGGGFPLPHQPVAIGDTYQLLDKSAKQSTFILADGVVNHGVDTFTVALTDCVDASTKSMATVTGFATVKIDRAQFLDPSWDQKHWTMTFLCSSTSPAPVGGGNFGTGVVSLLQ